MFTYIIRKAATSFLELPALDKLDFIIILNSMKKKPWLFGGKSMPELLNPKPIKYTDILKMPRGKRRKFKRKNPWAYHFAYMEMWRDKKAVEIYNSAFGVPLIFRKSKHKKRARDRSATRKPLSNTGGKQPEGHRKGCR